MPSPMILSGLLHTPSAVLPEEAEAAAFLSEWRKYPCSPVVPCIGATVPPPPCLSLQLPIALSCISFHHKVAGNSGILTSLNMTHQDNPWLDNLVVQTSKILVPFPDSHQSKVLGGWTFFIQLGFPLKHAIILFFSLFLNRLCSASALLFVCGCVRAHVCASVSV